MKSLFSLCLLTLSLQSSAEFLGPLTPEQYNIFIFSNGATYVEVVPNVGSYLDPLTSNCSPATFGILVADEDGDTDRIIAGVMAARARNDLLLLDIRGSVSGNPSDACVLNGIRVYSPDQ